MFNFMKKSSSAAAGVSTAASNSYSNGGGNGSNNNNNVTSSNSFFTLASSQQTNDIVGAGLAAATVDARDSHAAHNVSGPALAPTATSKEKRKQQRKEKQKRDRAGLSTEDLLRLDEVRRSLKIRGRRHKEKLPSGITADYTADFLANLKRASESPSPPSPLLPPPLPPPPPYMQHLAAKPSNGTTEHSYSDNVAVASPPVLPPKAPKRGILKSTTTITSKKVASGGDINLYHVQQYVSDNDKDTVPTLLQNVTSSQGQRHLLSSPSGNSLSDATNSSSASFTTTTPPPPPPFCNNSPVGESQGFHRWSKIATNTSTSAISPLLMNRDVVLSLPPITPLQLPPARTLTIHRQRSPRKDFGFSLRRAMVLERPLAVTPDSAATSTVFVAGGPIRMRAVIFAEPGAIVQHQNETGLLPGDKLLQVNSVPVETKSREEIIEMIKASPDFVTLKVQPVAELCELSRRSALDGGEVILADANIKGGTLQRSGSKRLSKSPMAKSECLLEREKQWQESEKVWLVHRAGFTAATRLPAPSDSADAGVSFGKCQVRLTDDSLQRTTVITVDEDDVELANPPQFDRIEDVVSLRHLNETSVLHTLRMRYASNLIHTYAGSSNLLVVNPMAPLAIYSEKVAALFKGCRIEDMPPHIYSMTQAAYRAMLQTRRDQSLVFLGRSGAGKTTNFRHSCQYLLTASAAAAATATAPPGGVAGPKPPGLTVEKLSALWTILENFGNCRTVLNSNATRFTHIFTVDFDQSGALVSSNLQVVLLERRRICCPTADTFHVVQRFLYGLVDGSLVRELQLESLCGANVSAEVQRRLQGEFAKIVHCFGVLEFAVREQRVVFATLAAILHLRQAGTVKTAASWQFANAAAGQRAATLLAIPLEHLQRAIFGGSSAAAAVTGDDEMVMVVDGADALDAFICALYAELVNLVVYLVNRTLIHRVSYQRAGGGGYHHHHASMSIFLVDVAGFQNPATCNGGDAGANFQDFCHNYLHERLQLLSHQVNVMTPLNRYADEAIEVHLEAAQFSCSAGPMVQLLDRKPAAATASSIGSQLDLFGLGVGGVETTTGKGLLWLLDEEAVAVSSGGGYDNTESCDQLFARIVNCQRQDSSGGGDQGKYYHQQQPLIRRASSANNHQFVLQHLQATNPVLYSLNGWLKQCRSGATAAKGAFGVLQQSSREDISQLYVSARGGLTGISSSFSSCLLGIDHCYYGGGDPSTKRTFSSNSITSGNSQLVGIKRSRKNVCLQMKFIVDGLIEMLRRTRIRFVHCLLPQHGAGKCGTDLTYDSTSATTASSAVGNCGQPDLINVPLLRSQLRGHQILDVAHVYKQGYPNSMPLGEFRRRFSLLLSLGHKSVDTVSTSDRSSGHMLDERQAVEKILKDVDLEASSYRVGKSLVFFRNGVLPQLESQRDEHVLGTVVGLQTCCRGYLARKLHAKRKLQDMAVRCVQRNVRKFLLVRHWPWWRLFQRVSPLLNVHRTEEELKQKTDELELLKTKLERLEGERTSLKLDNERLELKLTELAADVADEHSTATLAAERLDAEQTDRIRLERELNAAHERNQQLQQTAERLEMELVCAAHSDCTGSTANSSSIADEDDNHHHHHHHQEDNSDMEAAAVYKQRYKRSLKELEFLRKRLQQQHEDDLEQLVGLKKQLEKKLSDAYEEVEEQRQVVAQWKRKVQRLTGEMNDLRILLDEQNARNNLLEKKQRRFDGETSLMADELKAERQQKERVTREKDVLTAEVYTLETQLGDVRLELECTVDKLAALQRDFDEMTTTTTSGGSSACPTADCEEAATVGTLRRHKLDLERRLHDQDEELDELAGQVQLLEQTKLRLEMALEGQRKEARKECQMRDEEVDELRCTTHKKLKSLEQQLEGAHEERASLVRDKHDLERRLNDAVDAHRVERTQRDEVLARLRRDLKRTRCLLRDAHLQLEGAGVVPSTTATTTTPTTATHQPKEEKSGGTQLLRQLRYQLDESEGQRATVQRQKHQLEADYVELQSQLEDVQRGRQESDQRVSVLARERSDLQSQLDDNEAELSEVLRKYRGAVHQLSQLQHHLQEQYTLVGDLEGERRQLADQLAEATARLEAYTTTAAAAATISGGGDVAGGGGAENWRRTELKLREVEQRLELEQVTRARCETQLGRAREAAERAEGDVAAMRTREAHAVEEVRRWQRTVRDLKEEATLATNRHSVEQQKRKDVERHCQLLDVEVAGLRTDLKLATKRIDELQMALQDGGEEEMMPILDDDVEEEEPSSLVLLSSELLSEEEVG